MIISVWLVGFILNCSLRSVTLFPWQLYHQQRSSSPTILSSHAFALGHSDMPDKCFKAQLPALYIAGILFDNSGQELLSDQAHWIQEEKEGEAENNEEVGRTNPLLCTRSQQLLGSA